MIHPPTAYINNLTLELDYVNLINAILIKIPKLQAAII